MGAWLGLSLTVEFGQCLVDSCESTGAKPACDLPGWSGEQRDIPVVPSPVRDDIFVETQRTNAKLRRSDIEACRPAGALNERGCDCYKYSAPTELN